MPSNFRKNQLRISLLTFLDIQKLWPGIYYFLLCLNIDFSFLPFLGVYTLRLLLNQISTLCVYYWFYFQCWVVSLFILLRLAWLTVNLVNQILFKTYERRVLTDFMSAWVQTAYYWYSFFLVSLFWLLFQKTTIALMFDFIKK